MKKHLVLLSTLVLFTLSACSKFAGDIITQDFGTAGSYTAIEAENAFDVIVNDAVNSISVIAGEHMMPKTVVEVVDNTLKIRIKGLLTNYDAAPKVIIPYNADLRKVTLSGACDFHSDHALTGTKVEVDLSGASGFHANIEADEAEVKVSGASDATIDGQVNKLKINLSGGSRIVKGVAGKAYALKCNACEGTMTGASKAWIDCDGTIKVTLSGASELHYTGDAASGNCSCTGGSKVVRDVL